MTREEIEQAIEAAGWRLDEGFSSQLLVGNNHNLSILAHQWVWGTDDPVFELSDEQTKEHGRPADEEQGNPYKQDR